MLFFDQGSYPKDATLYDQLLKESTNFPLIKGLEYFRNYVKNGGGRVHPILGDLHDFLQEIDRVWDRDVKGNNFVAEFLRATFPRVASTPACA